MCGETGENLTSISGEGNHPEQPSCTDKFPQQGVPVVAGVVIETIPGRASKVGDALRGIEGLQVMGSDGDRRLAGVWMAASGKELLAAVEELLKTDEDVVGVFPTFIGQDDS